jgi:hypothetical protein
MNKCRPRRYTAVTVWRQEDSIRTMEDGESTRAGWVRAQEPRGKEGHVCGIQSAWSRKWAERNQVRVGSQSLLDGTNVLKALV